MRLILPSPRWPLVALAFALTIILLLFLFPYGGQPSALFHMDVPVHTTYQPPSPFVVLGVPGYDGMHYYGIAKRIPLLLTPEGRASIGRTSSLAYAYQRFLLPLTAWSLSFGQAAALPFTFLLIQIVSLMGVTWVLLRARVEPLYALALSLSPAAMVGLHFSLAEPLTLVLVTLLLVRYLERLRIGAWDILLLSLLVLTREVNIFLVVFLLGYSMVTRRWRDALWLILPAAVFVLWHGVIYAIFTQIPFLWSTDKRALPFTAIGEILLDPARYTPYSATSIALFLLFVLPAIIVLLRDLWQRPRWDALVLGSLFFLSIMSVMPDQIWGAITSIGRVITPVYPFTVLYYARRNDLTAKLCAAAILLLGLGTAVSLAVSVHPFVVL